MPERLDTVTIALARRSVTISWEARQALLGRLQHVNSASSIRAAFAAGGASNLVELRSHQIVALQSVLVHWDEMPAELDALRDRLTDELLEDE